MQQNPLDRLHFVAKKLQPKYLFPQEDGFRLTAALTVNVTIH